MMKRTALLAALLVLTGCGFKVGPIKDPPASGGFGLPANVTVYRAPSIIGLPVPMTFLIDSVEIYGLWAGDEYSFSLDPGDYVFGYFLGLNECRRWGRIEPGRSYRIKLAPNCVIERDRVGDASEIVGSYTIDLVNDEFDLDSARLKPEMKWALDDLARRVRASPGEELLTIVGHTDSSGSAQYNRALGQRRADASRDYLVSSGGLSSARIRTSSAGDTSPVASNDTPDGRARNRRIEIVADVYRAGL